ncbi:hypothetical protein TMPK1_32660 [Rhodospirillales bacterium TMPK1]|uniref:Uncharacterized protein n=2 Tax=Roseiterribacter gracilis TaxID=2812848 RepID=A0A8S8XGK3_9PROT|nr:hypothetical protein TMPK1_32660 [Rhodospirillales bacterium TMPK1]
MLHAPRLVRWAKLVVLVAVFAVGFFWLAAPARNPGNSFAFACDPFGYLRQAQLFQQKGLIGGLDTSIRRSDAQYLVDQAKRLGLPERTWADGVAPHCYRYDSGSQAIIGQYPPGTGFFLSLFRQGTGGQHSYTVAIGLAAIAALAACLLFQPGPFGVVLAAGAVVGMTEMLRVPMSFASYSIPWSVALIAICAMVAICLPMLAGRRQLGVGLLLGLLTGMLVQLRLPNIFIAAGLAVFLIVEWRLWTLRAIKQHAVVILASSATFLLAGPGLLAWFNRINTGSALRTTYGASDATGVEFLWSVIRPNAKYYFWTGDDWAFVDASLVLLALAAMKAISPGGRGLRGAVAGSAVLMAITTAFFLTHRIAAPYYMVPSAALVIFLLAFAWCRLPAPRFVLPARAVAIVLIGFACLVGLRMKASSAPLFKMIAPQEILQPDAVVWSEIMSGSLLYYNDKFAAKLPFVHFCTRFDFVRAIQEVGRPQYFVVDSDLLRSNVKELAASTEQVGVYDAQEPFPVLRLVTMNPKPAGCP